MKLASLVSVVFLCFPLVFLSCGAKSETIRLGINPWPGYEFLHLAKEKGFFAEEKFPVKLIEMSSLSDIRRAYERGQLEGMAVTLIEGILAMKHSDRAPRVALVADYSNGADVILGQPGIQSISDLKGKRIGAEYASLTLFILARALEKNGMGLLDVQLQPMDQLEMERAFVSQAIDAAVCYPPVSIHLSQTASANELFNSGDIPGEVVDVIMLDKAVLERNPDAPQKLLRVWGRALRYAKEHEEDAFAFMAEQGQITVEEFRQALEGISVVPAKDQREFFKPGGKLRQSADAIQATLMATGRLDNPIDVSGLILPWPEN